MEFKDYYQILGVSPEASQEEIRRAWRKLARKYHPDVSDEPDAEEKYKEANEAYEALKDPEKRQHYDRIRAGGWRSGQEFRPPPGAGREFRFGGGEFTGADFGPFSDFFEAVFGRMGEEGAFPGGRVRTFRTAFRMRGEDLHYRIRLGLEEAYHGATRSVQLRVPEADAQGRVTERTHTLHVKIPAGVTNGSQIRLKGQGQPGVGGGEPGDLYLEVELEPHRLFSVEGRDVILDVPVAPWEAALGATVHVPTLAGEVELKVPPGAHNGQRLRLRGKGLPGRPPGNQIVVLRIEVPRRVSERARELYEELARETRFNPREHLRR